jgi:hypothetical protein
VIEGRVWSALRTYELLFIIEAKKIDLVVYQIRKAHGIPMSSGVSSASLKVCPMSFYVTSSFASEFNSSAKYLRGMGCSPRRIVIASHIH